MNLTDIEWLVLAIWIYAVTMPNIHWTNVSKIVGKVFEDADIDSVLGGKV